MPASPDLGTRFELLGPYDLVSNRGKVVTYRARDRETREEVLACVLKKHLARDEGVRTALAFGLDALSRLDHPGVMQVVDLRLSDDVVYFVKKTPGRTLSHWLRAGTVFTEADAVAIVRSLLDALAHAHERGVHFGNIKPSNVVVDLETMKAMVVAIPKQEFSFVSLAHTAAYLGVPHDCPPEVLRSGTFDERADVYGAGVVLHKMAAGSVSTGGNFNLAEIFAQVVDRGLPPVQEVNAFVGKSLAQVIDRAVAQDPSDRFPDARAMSHALSRVQVSSAPLLPRDRLLDIVRHQFPNPVARTYISIQAQYDEEPKLQRLIDTVHCIVQLLSSAALAQRSSEDVREAIRTLGVRDLSRPSLGTWLALLRREAAAGCEKTPELQSMLFDSRGRPRPVLATLERLVALRNDVRHGSCLPRVAARKRLEQALPELEEVFREILRLRRHSLVVIDDLDYREGSFRCRMRSLRGIDQEATFQTVRLAHPVTEGHVYLADEDGLPLVCLHPLVIVAECPKCDEHEMFFFESAGDERAHYFSFDHSHQLSEEALLAELVEHGYVAT